MSILVLGETGAGKSTLINNLRADGAPSQTTGKTARGVTKQPTRVLATFATLVDMPGVGDMDVPLARLIAVAERELDRGVAAIVVATKATDGRLRLGTQFARKLAEGCDCPVVLVGTFADRADPDELACFRDSVVPCFFCCAAGGPAVLTSRHDCSRLVRVLEQLPLEPRPFRRLSATEWADAFADVTGLDHSQLVERLVKERASC